MAAARAERRQVSSADRSGDGNQPSLDIHPSGRLLAVGLEGGVAFVVSLEGEEVTELGVEEPTYGTLVALSPSGRYLATAARTADPTIVRIWDLNSGTAREIGRVSAWESSHLRFHDENHLLWIGMSPSESGGPPSKEGGYGKGGGERLFDLTTGETSVRADTSREFFRAVSRSGSIALSVDSGEGTDYVLWRDLESGATRPIISHGQMVMSAAIDPSEEWMVTGDYYGIVKVGRISGEEPHMLMGHGGAVFAVAVSPDGRWVATGGDDGTVRLWPAPDMAKPPFHTLPHDGLMAKLRSLTNVRVVEEAGSPSGWKLDYAPFPGWQEVPQW